MHEPPPPGWHLGCSQPDLWVCKGAILHHVLAVLCCSCRQGVIRLGEALEDDVSSSNQLLDGGPVALQ